MSPVSQEWNDRLERLRAEWNAYVGDQGTRFSFEFTEQQVLDLASGYVPLDVRAMCMACLDWREDDRRRAERPLKQKQKASA